MESTALQYARQERVTVDGLSAGQVWHMLLSRSDGLDQLPLRADTY